MEYLLFFLYPLALIRPVWIAPALVLHAALIAGTAHTYGRIPLIGLHETLSFLAFALGAVYLAAAWRRRRDRFTYLVLSLVLAITAGSVLSPVMPGSLPPVLKTFWFELHVVLSFVSYALFAVGAAYGLLALAGTDPAAERNQYRSILLGYVLFSAAMIFGGIWAFYAWGTYWLWTPKELWTTIVWFFYSLYLHGRLVRGWRGTRVVWMGITGFLIVLFTYVGVGLFMKSSHQF